MLQQTNDYIFFPKLRAKCKRVHSRAPMELSPTGILITRDGLCRILSESILVLCNAGCLMPCSLRLSFPPQHPLLRHLDATMTKVLIHLPPLLQSSVIPPTADLPAIGATQLKTACCCSRHWGLPSPTVPPWLVPVPAPSDLPRAATSHQH